MGKRHFLFLLLLMLALVALAACGEKKSASPGQWSSAPAMQIDANKTYTASFDTSKGSFKVELFAKDAPKTVNSFVFLAKEGFYNGLTFHRVVKSFMIQGGDPLGNGTGGPGYTIEDEKPKVKYDPGIVAMARTSAPNSAGSQFFICTGASCANLNQSPTYAVFGKVIEGMDTVMKIDSVPVKLNPMSQEVSTPTETVKIKKVTITEK